GTASNAAIKKFGDDIPKKKLTDLEEVVEEAPDSDFIHVEERKTSSGSILSDRGDIKRGSQYVLSTRKRSSDAGSTTLEALWENARRLSEAGVRRTSDASIVLTEDTDSFIIGDRIWVGGTKPGQIAYIGETQFAPGEWAGVVLDEAVGKNDGSVAGVRYFQCEPKRGVFSRLTRLTRVPLQHGDIETGAGGDSSALPRPSNGTASPIRRLTPIASPSSSVKDLQLKKSTTPSLNSSVTNLNSSHTELKLGERVIVMSSQGSKAGTLRYVGTTEFAAGEWCGVELDDPLGKNDGSVEGKRYFECQPKFGLFAPAHKVSKSPSSRRPSSSSTCMIHRGTPAAGVKRVNSRESLVSVTSSTASSVRGARVRLGVTSLGKKPGIRTPSTPVSAKTSLQ
ncbi:hypothetical protein L9F63_011103, partial [Diploptera punctata]